MSRWRRFHPLGLLLRSAGLLGALLGAFSVGLKLNDTADASRSPTASGTCPRVRSDASCRRRPLSSKRAPGAAGVLCLVGATITTTASGNIIATICVVAAVLIVGAFLAGRRSVKTPAPAREYFGESGRDAVETDKV